MNPLQVLRRRRQSAENRRYVRDSYRHLVGIEPDRATTELYLSTLENGGGRNEALLGIVRSQEYLERVAATVGERPDTDDPEFLGAAYQNVLEREADPEGLRFYGRRLKEGTGRRDVVKALAASDEHVNRVTAALLALPSLRERWPAQYVEARNRKGTTVPAFNAPSAEWLDRMESAILENDYYEKPGIWEYSVNLDKRLMAEIVASLQPRSVLEMGCSNGTVLQKLYEAGVDVTGLDISPSAIARADPSVRDRIRLGDLLTIELPETYDVVFGLDVFEHLNPNRLGDYLKRVTSLTSPGGFVFTNLPAFGDDPVFGTVFEVELEEWERDAANGRRFSLMPVDDEGYPRHGHLVWADSDWWVRQFEAAGLKREPAVERALHECYDEYMRQNSPARRSFYVFSNQADPSRVAGIADRIRTSGSQILREEWEQRTPDGVRKA